MKHQNIYLNFVKMGVTALAVVGIIALNVEGNSPEKAEQLLKTYQLHDIKVGGYNWWCVEGTLLHRKFEAKNAQNEEVEGSICANRFLIPDDVEIKKKVKP